MSEETLTEESDRWYAYQYAGGYPIQFYRRPPALDENDEIINGSGWVDENYICELDDLIRSAWIGLGGARFGPGCRVIRIPKNPFSITREESRDGTE